MNVTAEHTNRVFAYGSLMWRPDFEFETCSVARLNGYHRRLSVFSNHYRGTPEAPGLVFGLDKGGSCLGVVYEVAPKNWPQVLKQIRARELITHVYREEIKLALPLGDDTPIAAVTYIVDRTHQQYAAPMPLKDTLTFIEQGQGLSGSCRDYVWNTLKHLRSLGITDKGLETLALHLEPSRR